MDIIYILQVFLILHKRLLRKKLVKSLIIYSKVKVYTFLDGSEHIFYDNEWYDLKSVNDLKINPVEYIKPPKSQEEINLSKAHKPASNHPWKNVKPINNNLRIKIAFGER